MLTAAPVPRAPLLGARSDPITEFVRCLFVDYNFDGAQEQLAKCEEVLDNDFFLVAAKDAFMEAARQFLFENYCRIHQVGSVFQGGGLSESGESALKAWEPRGSRPRPDALAALQNPSCRFALPVMFALLLPGCPPLCRAAAGHQHPQPEREAGHGRGGDREVDCQPHQVNCTAADVPLCLSGSCCGVEAGKQVLESASQATPYRLICRNARLNAKIDSKAGTVVMQTQTLSAYEQLLERSRALGLRTLDLSNAVFGALRA